MSGTRTSASNGAPDPAVAAPAEDLSRLVADLGAQVADLVKRLKEVAADRAGAVSGEIAEGVDDAAREAARRGRRAREAVETTIHDHPVVAIGIAAGLGLLLGFLMRR